MSQLRGYFRLLVDFGRCNAHRPFAALLVAASLFVACARTALVIPDRFPEGAACQAAPCYIQFAMGQADSALLLFKDHAALFDLGASIVKHDRAAYQHVGDVIERLIGKRHLTYAIASHYHQDHIGHPARRGIQRAGYWGLFEVLGFHADFLVTRGYHLFGNPKPPPSMMKFRRASLAWVKEGLVGKIISPRLGSTLEMGPGLEVRIVSKNGNGRLEELYKRAGAFFADYPASENDYSMAFKITYGDFELFVGGDLTGVDCKRRFGPMGLSYNDIESRTARRVGDIEVYHVTHHGSGNSTNPCFVNVLAPEVAIFPTGRNGYGHPAPRVYRTLKNRADIYITNDVAKGVRNLIDPKDIVHGDVMIVLEPGGRRYWVNGKPYRAFSEEQEQARPGYKSSCDAEEPASDLDDQDPGPLAPAKNGER